MADNMAEKLVDTCMYKERANITGKIDDLNYLQEKFPRGSVAYYIDGPHGSRIPPYGTLPDCQLNSYPIEFGIVDVHYPTTVVLRKITLADNRRFDGMKMEELPLASEWKRLPKGWAWDTKLDYNVTFVNRQKVDITDPVEIINAYNDGILIDVDKFDYAIIDSQFGDRENTGLYRIVKKYEYLPESYVSLRYDEIYARYAEVSAERRKRLAEMHRVMELSDYDWSVEQIDNQLGFWATSYGVSKDDRERVRNYLLSLGRIEDLVVRIYSGNVEWKYDREKKWKTILVDTL